MKFLRESIFLVGMALTACQISDQMAEPGKAPQSENIVVHDQSNDWSVLHEGRKIFGNTLAKTTYNVHPYKWNKTALTYRLNGSWTTRDKAIAADAFNAIGSVIPLTFQLVSASSASDIEISLVPQSELPTNPSGDQSSGETIGTVTGTTVDNLAYTHALIKLSYSGGAPLATRYNEMMHVLMHEIGHALGMAHSEYSTAMMFYKYTRSNGIPKLHFLKSDDIQGLQSKYGPVPPKYPTWDHRYNLGFMMYISTVPAPGAQPIGWVLTGTAFAKWSNLEDPGLAYQLNSEELRLAIRK